jgi:hypothetical protein
MNAAWPIEICPQYPTSRFSPIAARARIRNGMSIDRKK